MKKYFLVLISVLGLCSCTSIHKKEKSETPKTDPPKLLKPIVNKIWIPPEIRNGGTEWVEGHYMYRIEKETSWSR